MICLLTLRSNFLYHLILGGGVKLFWCAHFRVCAGYQYKTFLLKRFFSIFKKTPPHHQKTDFSSWRIIRDTKKKSKSLFRPNIFTIGGFKGYLVGKMAIKGGVVDMTFLSKMCRFAVKCLFWFSKSSFRGKSVFVNENAFQVIYCWKLVSKKG